MKERLKTLIVGIVIGALFVPTVFATVGTIKKELSYNDIKITLDGAEIKPTDASGNYVEPFIMDGTTYLPVRGIASALDLGVEWDSASKTVKLASDKGASAPSTGGVTQIGDVIVNESGVKVTLTDIVVDNSYSKYYFLLENNSANVAYFMGSEISANDFMINDFISSTHVQPGKKAEFSLYINTGEYSSPRITEVNKIEMNGYLSFSEVDTFKQLSEHTSKIIMNF